jgi:hypothetical protein
LFIVLKFSNLILRIKKIKIIFGADEYMAIKNVVLADDTNLRILISPERYGEMRQECLRHLDKNGIFIEVKGRQVINF